MGVIHRLITRGHMQYCRVRLSHSFSISLCTQEMRMCPAPDQVLLRVGCHQPRSNASSVVQCYRMRTATTRHTATTSSTMRAALTELTDSASRAK